jgi:hypothetical protein
MSSDHRERSFENALARHLRPDAPRAACLDPETLAAFHQQSLAPEQMASSRAHVSDCPHCQQILAHLRSTDEIPMPATNIAAAQAAAKSGVRILPVRRPRFASWVAPVGALAAGVLIWVAIHESNSGRFGKPQPTGEAKPIEIAKAQPSFTPPLPPPSADATTRNEQIQADALRRSHVVQPSISKISPSPQRSQSLAKEKDFPSASKKSAVAGLGGALAAASPKPANPANPASQPSLQPEVPRSVSQTVEVTAEAEPARNELATTQAAATGSAKTEPKAKSENDKRDAAHPAASSMSAIAGGAPSPAPAAPPQQSAQTVQVMTESAEVSNLPVQNRQVANLTNLNPGALLLASTTGGVTVSAPGGRVSWRIGQAGVILFSSDSGKTWLVQPSGIITDLLSGSAPSAKVCWLVGRSGTILLTTDKGKHWRKVPPPTQDDFLSVFAVNARQATVSPASGTYQTTDRGATWNKLPPE